MGGKLAHLHLHTKYSLKDAMNKTKELLKRAKELDIYALAITDHGNMFGIVEFAKAAKAEGVKLIIGCEAYIDPRGIETRGSRDNRHLVLLAKNEVGYKNLITLMSKASIDGFYYDPRIDHELLKEHHEGLIALSACLGGDVAREIQNHVPSEEYMDCWDKGYEAGYERALWYKNLFGEDFYLEVQDNGIHEQYLLNDQLYKIADDLNIELVATNDAHYPTRDWFDHHDALMALGSGTNIYSEKRKKYTSDEFFIKSYDDFKNSGKLPMKAIDNTVVIADKCDFELEFGVYKIPEFTWIPEGLTSEEYLRQIVTNGLIKCYDDWEEKKDEIYIPRMDYEIGIISKMGFIDYFLIVWDFVKYAMDNKFYYSPGRGSGAGSIVAYGLEITHIDPIKHNLLFERFLSPSRVSMPDIDWDISDRQRQYMIRYVEEKYGKDHVGQILTLQNMLARGALKAAASAYGYTWAEGDRLAKMVPEELGITIDEALEASPDLKSEYDQNEASRRIIDTAKAFEGLPKETGTHAAGVVIAPHPLMGNIPLWMNRPKTGKTSIVTQMDMVLLEELGYLKMDFLGLNALTIIGDTIKFVKENHGVDIDYYSLIHGGADDEPEVYKLIAAGNTEGIFQLEGEGMTKAAMDMQIKSFDELTALISLYRPGPMAYIPDYIENKNHPENIHVPFKELEPILKDTYGVLVYQEQLMQLVRDIAGYDMALADDMRRAVSKKKEEAIQKHKDLFVTGTDANGNQVIPGGVAKYSAEALIDYYDNTIRPFGKYAFNKSHAASYARVAVCHAYLKAFYPVEFMAAVLQAMYDKNYSPEKLMRMQSRYFSYCKNISIDIVRPDIQVSPEHFLPMKSGTIMYGLKNVRDVGKAAHAVVKERERNGRYKGPADLFNRLFTTAGVTVKTVEALIRVGALQDLGIRRTEAMACFMDFQDVAQRRMKRKDPNSLPLLTDDDIPELEEFPEAIILKAEKRYSGSYLSGHPLDVFRRTMTSINTLRLEDVDVSSIETESEDDLLDSLAIQEIKEAHLRKYDGARYRGIVLISDIREYVTKSKDLMAYLTIEDTTGSASVTVFPKDYRKIKNVYKAGDIVEIKGKFQMYNGSLSILQDAMIKQERESILPAVHARITAKDIRGLKVMAVNHPGKHPLVIEQGNASWPAHKEYWVSPEGARKIIENYDGYIMKGDHI